MHKSFRKTSAFYIIATLFWVILALIAFSKLFTINYSADEVKDITGEITSLEKREINDFYYFQVDVWPDVNFRISHTDNISFEELSSLHQAGKKVTFQVDSKNYFFSNKEGGDVEVLSLKNDEEIFWTVEVYCNQERRSLIIRLIVCIIMACGMLFSYIYVTHYFLCDSKKMSFFGRNL